MANEIKRNFSEDLKKRYGAIRGLEKSQSLFEIRKAEARIYIRYSKVHNGNRTWYGLRNEDLLRLEGYPSLICFLWNGQDEPLFLPYSEYEEVFQSVSPAGDGQYKAQVFLKEDGAELYIVQAGRFNVEGNFGWSKLVNSSSHLSIPELSHNQIQTLLGSIGAVKNYDVWIPANDRLKLDWSITSKFKSREVMPYGFEKVKNTLQEVGVIWINKGSSKLIELFEVEHSTPIYSGLLRLNDIHLASSDISPRFCIMANESRKALVTRQINRPTFQTSGLHKTCTFLDYINVFVWHNRIINMIRKENHHDEKT